MTQTSQSILVVDDYKSLCDMLKEFLEVAGYEVRCAHDGKAAWTEIQRDPPDLVLSDINMPHLNGIDLATLIMSGGYQIPVILMSAPSDDWAEIGAVFVRKPFDFNEMLSAIKKLLEDAPPKPRQINSADRSDVELDPVKRPFL